MLLPFARLRHDAIIFLRRAFFADRLLPTLLPMLFADAAFCFFDMPHHTLRLSLMLRCY